jgi:AraC-like DNA-binding protein
MATTDNIQLAELRSLVASATHGDGNHNTAISSLCLVRYSASLTPIVGVLSPALCVSAQGRKELLVGDEVYSYGPGYYLVTPFELPTSARILGATRANPYLGLRLDFDPARLRPLIEEAGLSVSSSKAFERGLYVACAPTALIDAVLRLVRLLQHPAEIPIFAPMIEREILFRLLLDKASAVLHHIAESESQSQGIAVAVAWLRNNYHESMRIEQLAKRAGMSVSSFHHWFRKITGMSPLQYQKQLRLQEARTILRNERLDVGSVSRRVGYESSSHFSREYSRLFGMPPVREVHKAPPRPQNFDAP